MVMVAPVLVVLTVAVLIEELLLVVDVVVVVEGFFRIFTTMMRVKHLISVQVYEQLSCQYLK